MTDCGMHGTQPRNAAVQQKALEMPGERRYVKTKAFTLERRQGDCVTF
jgi:hypothetical protein